MVFNRRTIWFGLICAALAVLLVLTIVYSWLLLTPTGIEEIERPMAEARERVEKGVGGAPEGSDRGAAGQAQVAVQPFMTMINWFGVCNPALRGFYDRYRARREVPSELIACEKAAGNSLWAAIGDKGYGQVVNAARRQLLRLGSAGPLTDSEIGAVAKDLDLIEELLLRTRREMPKEADGVGFSFGVYFHAKALMAIERAGVRGDEKKALALLDGFLDTMRAWVHVYVNDGTIWVANPHVDARFFWQGIARVPNMPGEWREHARRTLAAIANTTQTRESWLYTAGKCREMATARLNNREAHASQNFLHFFGCGRIDGIAYHALKPVAEHEIESMCAAIGRGDLEGYRTHRMALAAALGAMNMNGSVLPYNEVDQFQVRPAEAVSMALRDREMIEPGGDDRATSDVVTVERFGLFENVTDGQLLGLQNQAIGADGLEMEGPGLMTPGEVDAFINKNKREDWRKFVKWYGPVKMKILWAPKGRAVKVMFPPEDEEFESELKKVMMREGGNWGERK